MRAASSLAIIWKANRNHTQGHSSLLATWSETQRQLVEPRGDCGPAFPARSCIIHLCTLASALWGGGGAGRARKISCCYGNGSQRRTRAVCRVGVGGARSVSLEAASRPRTCTTLCTRSRRKRGDRKCNNKRLQREKKKSTMQINKVFF